jgi:hypothetical protein
VDDILSISNDPQATLLALTSVFMLKDDKIGEPEVYLGAQLGKMSIDEIECWTMSAEKYVVASVKSVEEALARKGLRLATKCYTPLASDYKPELETSAELKSDGVQYYQELIGVLRWAVELGRVDIVLLDFYRDVKEAIPGDMPAPCGNPMSTHCFVDASHGSDRATRRSQTGILIF